MNRPIYRLLDWIDKNKLDWELLASNPNAIDLLRENPDKIDWDYLSANENAIELLRENKDKIDWYRLSSNPNAIELLRENPDKIDWDYLSANGHDANCHSSAAQSADAFDAQKIKSRHFKSTIQVGKHAESGEV